MMREILFHGKRMDNGEWVQGYVYRIWERVYILWGMTNDVPNMIEVDPETVGQFTGEFLNQRTFEGDVLNITDKYGKSKNWVVVFKDGAFMLKQDGVDFFAHFTDFPRKHYHKVVISNIHDNPELLEK